MTLIEFDKLIGVDDRSVAYDLLSDEDKRIEDMRWHGDGKQSPCQWCGKINCDCRESRREADKMLELMRR